MIVVVGFTVVVGMIVVVGFTVELGFTVVLGLTVVCDVNELVDDTVFEVVVPNDLESDSPFEIQQVTIFIVNIKTIKFLNIFIIFFYFYIFTPYFQIKFLTIFFN